MKDRDYRKEARDAIRSGDVDALGDLVMALLIFWEKDREKRDRAAEKKRRQRADHGSDVPGTQGDIWGQPGTTGTSGDTPQGFPTPLPTPPAQSTTPSARARCWQLIENPTQRAEAEAFARRLESRAGDHWPSIERFLDRREAKTVLGWLRHMDKEVGPGSQYDMADLAQVCDDDEALKAPLSSPFALRSFLGNAHRERVNRESQRAPPAANATPSRRGSPKPPQQHKYDNPTTSDADVKWQK